MPVALVLLGRPCRAQTDSRYDAASVLAQSILALDDFSIAGPIADDGSGDDDPIHGTSVMRLEAKEPRKIVIGYVIDMTTLIYVVFDQLLTIPWPQTLLGTMFPVLHATIPSM